MFNKSYEQKPYKVFHPRIEQIINEIENNDIQEGFGFGKPNSETIETVGSFYKKVDITLQRKCRKELLEVEKHTNFSLNNTNNTEKLSLKFGHVIEGTKAVDALDRCKQEIENIVASYQSISLITSTQVEYAADLCVDDCNSLLNTNPNVSNEALNSCVRACFKNTTFAIRAVENVLARQAIKFSNELDLI